MPKAAPIVLACALLVLTLPGCFQPGDIPGVAVSGHVTYQRKPIASGMIYFDPDPSTRCRGASTAIIDGGYAFDSTSGPTPGKFIIRVSVIKNETGPDGVTIMKETMPDKYNLASKEIVVIPEKRKSYEFLVDLD